MFRIIFFSWECVAIDMQFVFLHGDNSNEVRLFSDRPYKIYTFKTMAMNSVPQNKKRLDVGSSLRPLPF